jgi:hypothetical protein
VELDGVGGGDEREWVGWRRRGRSLKRAVQ